MPGRATAEGLEDFVTDRADMHPSGRVSQIREFITPTESEAEEKDFELLK